MYRRRPRSLEFTLALTLAGLALYLPANLLPVMHTSSLTDRGGDRDSTIISGIIDFWRNGSVGIALLILVASLVIPSVKFLSLGLLMWRARPNSLAGAPALIRLHRILDLIGYWSMLDVLIVGLVTATVKFHAISDAEPRIGILYFGLVVILTKLATMSFDPRLLTDQPSGSRHRGG